MSHLSSDSVKAHRVHTPIMVASPGRSSSERTAITCDHDTGSDWSHQDCADTDTTPGSSCARDITSVYRHDPYSLRGYVRLDAWRDKTSVPMQLRGAHECRELQVPLRVVQKADVGAIELRPRLSVPPFPVPKKPAPAKAPAAAGELGTARKALKKACSDCGVALEEPLYPLVVDVTQIAAHADRAALEQCMAQRRALRHRDEWWLQRRPLVDGNATLTGVPNVDGHRVALVLLEELRGLGLIDGEVALAHDARSVDRLNTGACHVCFELVADAERVQAALQQWPMFVDFRCGVCCVAPAKG
jgi:hypothetical protein